MRLVLQTFTLTLIMTLSACTTFHQTAPTLLNTDGLTLKKTWYNAETVADDGTHLRMTVYQPAIKRGQSAPLLIHAHGWAIGRMQRPFSIYGKLMVAGKSALRAWDEGYYVISYDQRGQGASSGQIGLMDADKEPQDVSRIIDWGLKNLSISTVDDKPAIGMIGESYGGGVQLLASVQDARITTIVPLTAWYNLDEALFPNNVPKTDWLFFLGISGYALLPTSMDHRATSSALSEIFGKGNPKFRERLQKNGLVAHCSDSEKPHADALLIQGMRDVLFPLNQALDTRECLQRSNRDVRMIAVEDGHLMPFSQSSPQLSMPLWHVQDQVTCDGHVYKVANIIDDWLNGKLRNDSAALARVPDICVTGDDAIDHHLPTLVWQNFAEAHLHSGATGWLEYIARPLDYFGRAMTARGLPSDWEKPSDGWIRPAQIPLVAVKESTWIVGVPKVSLKFVDNNRPNATIFLSLAVWTPGSGTSDVLNQQVTPARADLAVNGQLDIDLNAVRYKLSKGQVLGLLVQGHSNQFRLGGSGFFTSTGIVGKIGLPLAKVSEDVRKGSNK
jgi:ABC-2 type transport system ATP-binding protein